MAARINIVEDGKSTIITIKNTLGIRISVLFFIEALVGLLSAVAFIWIFFAEDHQPLSVYPILLAAIICFSIVAYRYLNRVTEQEIIKVDDELLIIRHKALLSSSEAVFEVDKIGLFSYDGFAQYTDHPLKGESFDYLGFQTADKQIQTLHEDGNISFDYEGRTFQFGKRLPSWDIEKVYDAIIQTTGDRIRLNISQASDDVPEASD